MFKRLIWFSSGAVSGAAGGWYLKRRIEQKLRERFERFTPGGVRNEALRRAKQAQADARNAVQETRRLADRYRDRAPEPLD